MPNRDGTGPRWAQSPMSSPDAASNTDEITAADQKEPVTMMRRAGCRGQGGTGRGLRRGLGQGMGMGLGRGGQGRCRRHRGGRV